MKRTEKKAEKERKENKSFRGEWVILIAVLVISAITAFLFTQTKLNESERKSAVESIQTTPTPVKTQI